MYSVTVINTIDSHAYNKHIFYPHEMLLTRLPSLHVLAFINNSVSRLSSFTLYIGVEELECR